MNLPFFPSAGAVPIARISKYEASFVVPSITSTSGTSIRPISSEEEEDEEPSTGLLSLKSAMISTPFFANWVNTEGIEDMEAAFEGASETLTPLDLTKRTIGVITSPLHLNPRKTPFSLSLEGSLSFS